MSCPRRRFLGLLAASPLALHAVNPTGKALRLAVIGHTGRGDFGHGLDSVLQRIPGIDWVAFADPDPAGLARVQARTGVRGFPKSADLLREIHPDGVVIAMRHADQHAAVASACLEAGCHVYLEKPFVRSPEEADAVLEIAARHHRRVGVAHTMRLAPVIQALRSAVEAGALGELRQIRAHGKQDARAGGEDLMVLGSHLFDLMRAFAGDPTECSARVWQQGRPVQASDRRRVRDEVGWVAGDRVHASFTFNGGVHATFVSDAPLRDSLGHWGLELVGSKGSARILADLSPRVFLRSGPEWSKDGPGQAPVPFRPDLVVGEPGCIAAPVEDWIQAIRNQREPGCSGRNGAWAVEMVAAIYRSSLAGAAVRLPLAERSHPLAP